MIRKYIGLDVHKKSISISIVDGGRDGEVGYYGKIDNELKQQNKVIHKLISTGVELWFEYEAGPCWFRMINMITCLLQDYTEPAN